MCYNTEDRGTYNSEKEKAAENASSVTFKCCLGFEHEHPSLDWRIATNDEIECVVNSNA